MIDIFCDRSGLVCRGKITGNLNHILREATTIVVMVANQMSGGNMSARNILLDSIVDRIMECKHSPVELGKDMRKEQKNERTEQAGAVLCAGGDQPEAEAGD